MTNVVMLTSLVWIQN